MTISTEEYIQDAIKGDMVQLEKLLEICNVPAGKVKQIKEVVKRAIVRGSDYGYCLGQNDRFKAGERSKYCDLIQQHETLQQRYARLHESNRKNYNEIKCLRMKLERLQRLNGLGKRL